MTTTPTAIIEQSRMAVGQWAVVVVMFVLNALDGFDVLSISFAAPGIARDWDLDHATLGWMLSMELIGMAVGSLCLGAVGDRIGRRNTILLCLVAMAVGMFGASYASNTLQLLSWRLLTGLGIGGMLSVITAASAEFANARWRSFAVALMVIGYPIGGVVGGMFVRSILASGTWQDVFLIGFWATAAMIPVVLALVPESPVFLDRQRSPNALEKINRVLSRFGHASAKELSPHDSASPKPGFVEIFGKNLRRTTLLVTMAYFALITSFYFLVKWVPKLIVDMGYASSEAAGVLMWVNVGGATGAILFGIIASRIPPRNLAIVVLIGTAVMITWFGRGSTELRTLTLVAGCAGFFANSAICGLYSLFATVFPPQLRATGTGFAIGVGRGGALLAPVGAGYLFQAGFGLQTVALVMASTALLAAVLLCFLNTSQPELT